MNLRDFILQQYDYVVWSDDRCLTAAASVLTENFDKQLGFSFGSVHRVLLHMLGAQDLWLGRWQGDSTRVFPTVEELPTLEAIRQRWDKNHGQLIAFVRAQTDDSLTQRVNFIRNGQPHSGMLWMLMTHTFDHATYHRSQLNSLIKLAGGKPGDFSYITRLRITEGQMTE